MIKKKNLQSADLLQHGEPMSIKESYCTRKKKEKKENRGAKSTLQQITTNLTFLSLNLTLSSNLKKKKKRKKNSA
jgi:preprotein translocase subunit SecG